jgi:hypothetical protein
MPKRVLIATGLALLCGVPLYLLLDALDLLSPALRDRPWPLVLLAAAAALVAVAAARSARSLPARLCARAAMASPLALLLFATASAAQLPPQAPELMVGAALPDAALVAEGGEKLRLASLRGQPLVLVVYRGSS